MKKYVIALSLLLANCATHPDKIKAQYISPLQYNNYTCDQISYEMQKVSYRVSEISGVQKKASDKSKVAVGVGMIFWPAFFFVDSNSSEAAELGRLKREFNALNQVSEQKNCKIQIYRR